MPKDNGSDAVREKELSDKEESTFERRLANSPLTNILLAEGATLIKNNDMPRKQMQQLYRSQKRLHYGSDEEYSTLMGQVLKKNPPMNRQINALAKEAIAHAPPVISEYWQAEFEDIDTPRGSMDAEKFGGRLAPYIWKEKQESSWDSTIEDEFVEAVKKVCNQLDDSWGAQSTPLSDFMTWKAQFTSGANSGDPLFESLTKEQWSNQYIPALMPYARQIAAGNFELDENEWTRGWYVLFGRTPYRPVHGVSMLHKMVGAKLNYDLSNGLGLGKAKHIAWMPLDMMLERTAEAMTNVESTIHEDFKWFDSFVSPELNKAVLKGYQESRLLARDPENRNILEFLLTELTTPTYIRTSPHTLLKMKAGLYSGTPVTQLHGSIVHSAYLEVLRENHGLNITDYFVLSDDGMCTFDGTKTQAQAAVDQIMIPYADKIGMKLNPKKSYVADITEKKIMYEGGEKLIRHDVGPFLQKFPQIDPDLAFGNVPRLIRSTKGRERDFERDQFDQLYMLLPGLRRSERGDRAQMASWVQDFFRTLEVLAQIRPGYPRVRKIIQTYTKIYPGFWKKFDTLVEAAEATGGKLFDTATKRDGGASDKGTTRWLVTYLKEARSKGSFPPIPER